MQDKEFDKLFQDGFENFSIEPSKSSWSSIKGRLEAKPRRKNLSFFWMAAACTIILFTTGLYLFRPKHVTRLHGENKAVVVTKPEPGELNSESIPVTVKPKNEGTGKVILSKVIAPKKKQPIDNHNRVTKSINSSEQINILSKVAAKIETHEVHDLNKEAMIALTEQNEITKSAHSDSVVMNHPIAINRRRIKSVGDLVNFVIAKVDQREDKIIEMSDNDEGSSISGINLGVLKIKAVKTTAPSSFKVKFK